MDDEQLKDCVLYKASDDACSFYSFKNKKNQQLHSFADLDLSIRTHCQTLHITQPDLTESQLIQNRIGRKCGDAEKICGKHRYKFGVDFRPSRTCKHPKHQPMKKKKKSVIYSCNAYRASRISEKYGVHFAIGTALCGTCYRKDPPPKAPESDEDDNSADEDYEASEAELQDVDMENRPVLRMRVIKKKPINKRSI